MSALAEPMMDVAAGDRLARRNALVLAVTQALAGGNSTVLVATAAIVGTVLAPDKGLATPIDDVWSAVSANYTAGFAASVKGNDGHVYAVPTDYYPWAVFYRKDVFAAKNYTVPTNWDDFKALCAKMKTDGLFPIAMGQNDGWPLQHQ